jgi:hypothetical protein
VPAEKIIQFSAYQPKPAGTPAIENGVHLAPQGEGVYLGKSPANVGYHGIPDPTPLANSGEPGSHALPVHSETKVSPSTLVLPHAKLITLYGREWNSFRSRTAHCKKTNVPWPPERETFKKFLVGMGACPGPGPYTLHRIENDNPHYGPGLCKWALWALKEEQNNNKSDNVLLVDPLDGKKWTPKKIAEETGVTENMVRKRIKLLWTLYELLENKKSKFLRDKWLQADALPKPEPKGPKKVLRPITEVPSLARCLALSPIDDDHYEEIGETWVKNHNEICDEHDALIDWVNAFNAGVVPMPPYPNLKFLKNLLLKMTPERVALRFTPIPPPPTPAPTYSYKHDPADCMPDDEYDHDDS